MSEKTITLKVFRYSPEQGGEPTEQEYEVPFRDDWVVLDALNYIKDQIDGTLSYRWSCRMGVCGSCGMMVNGEPKLTCATFLRDYFPDEIRVAPLSNFSVVRDLVVELDDFLGKIQAVKPWIIPQGGEAGRRRRVSPNAGPACRVQAIQHVHQLRLVLFGLPGLWP